eukprot:TRINITY_DN68124_c0_g1_i1.p1 TRINITY_DN68124_c0_g1~~TRINITY_DN68124_c0_g1_i1.p1  ORF type:complete len:244 (+),score=22.65 TRINITY_DN68124_c0_g1_i1:82-813(+)
MSDEQAIYNASTKALAYTRAVCREVTKFCPTIGEANIVLRKTFQVALSRSLVERHLMHWVIAKRTLLKRMELRFPAEAVGLVAEYVGDARVITPMTAKIAKAIACSNALFETTLKQRALVDRALSDVLKWWHLYGAEHVVSSVDAGSTRCVINLTWPAGMAPLSCRELHQSLQDTNRFDEETQIIGCIKRLFEEPPLEFEVEECYLAVSERSSLFGVDALTRSNRDAALDLMSGRLALKLSWL